MSGFRTVGFSHFLLARVSSLFQVRSRVTIGFFCFPYEHNVPRGKDRHTGLIEEDIDAGFTTGILLRSHNFKS